MAAADYRIMTDATGQREASAQERIATALESMSVDRAEKTDLTSIIATGTSNTTGAAIAKGTYFYLNGALVQAKTDISSSATFTSGTNYEVVTAGGLNSLNDHIANIDSALLNRVKIIGGLTKTNTVNETFTFTMSKAYLIVIIRDANPGALALITNGFDGAQFLTQNNTAIQVTYSGNQCTITRTSNQWSYAIVLEF